MGAAVKGRSPRPLTSVCQLTESHSHAALAAPRMFQSILLLSGLGDNLGPLPYLNAMIHVQGPRFNIKPQQYILVLKVDQLFCLRVCVVCRIV